MVFSSPVFLFLFLPLTLVLAFIAARVDEFLRRRRAHLPTSAGHHGAQNLALLVVSLFFYLYGSGWQFLLMVASIVVSWGSALLIERTRFRGAAMAGAIILQIGVLGWFKYANFVVDQVNAVAGWLGLAAMPWTKIILPIGISFYVFQGISYSIDVYRRECAYSGHRERFDRSIVNAQIGDRDRSEATLA
jgi:alginate O-acetyltransferase complex protein AlgI